MKLFAFPGNGLGCVARVLHSTVITALLPPWELSGECQRNLYTLAAGPALKADLQRPLELGSIMADLPTFGVECLVKATAQSVSSARSV